AVKAAAIYIVARVLKTGHREALHRALLMAEGGEFAFVLYTAALGNGLFDAELNAQLTAAVIISMALTPILVILSDRFTRAPDEESFEDIDKADGLTGSVLLIGFGRFGQVTAQALLSRGID